MEVLGVECAKSVEEELERYKKGQSEGQARNGEARLENKGESRHAQALKASMFPILNISSFFRFTI